MMSASATFRTNLSALLYTARKLGMVLAFVFFTTYPIVQTMVALLVLLACMCGQLYSRPFKKTALNRLEFLSHLSGITTLMVGLGLTVRYFQHIQDSYWNR
jgi:hypothetical protein